MTLCIIDLMVTFQHNDTKHNRLNGDTQHKTFSIMKYSIMTLSIMTLSIMTLSMTDLLVTLSIKDIQHNDT